MSTANSKTGASSRPEPAVSERLVVNTVAAQDVKRRGVRAIVEKLEGGPVHVLQHNRPAFVAIREEYFRELLDEIEATRIRSSLADLEEGRVRFASPRDLMDELLT